MKKELSLVAILALSGFSYGVDFSFKYPVSEIYYTNESNCFFKGGCAEENLEFDSKHVAVDFMAGDASGNKDNIKALNSNFGKLKYSYTLYNGSQTWINVNMGKVVIVEHLLNNGENYLSLYAHLNSFEFDDNRNNKLDENIYLAQKQKIGIIGNSGKELNSFDAGKKGKNKHLHFELKNGEFDPSKNNNLYGDLWPFGYMRNNQINALNSSSTDEAVDKYFKTLYSINEVMLPFLSRTSNPKYNYDVYGIANQTIYGYLNSYGTFNGSSENAPGVGVLVKNGFDRSLSGSGGQSPSGDRKWLMRRNDVSLISLTGSRLDYEAGDYMFLAYVNQDSNGSYDYGKYGYPIKFSFVGVDDVIVDNDQRNVNTSYTSNIANIDESQKDTIPGYFLTAEVAEINSGAYAEWKPNITGVYKVYAHVPKNSNSGNVKYRIVNEGSSNQTIYLSANHNGNSNWVLLSSNTNNNNTFNFDNDTYIKLNLTDNTHLNTNEKVAFDAIKFEKVRENSSIYSTPNFCRYPFNRSSECTTSNNTFSNDYVARGDWKKYTVVADSTISKVRVEIKNLSSDVDLYVNKNSQVDLSNRDCRPYYGGRNSEVCEFDNSGNNTYYIGVQGYNSGSYDIKTTFTNSTSSSSSFNSSQPSWLPSGCSISSIIGSASDSLSSSCSSKHRSGKYAKYYKLTPSSSKSHTIDMISSLDTYLFLLDENGGIVKYNDDYKSHSNKLNSRVQEYLNSDNTYYIEATTFNYVTTGYFSLKVK